MNLSMQSGILGNRLVIWLLFALYAVNLQAQTLGSLSRWTMQSTPYELVFSNDTIRLFTPQQKLESKFSLHGDTLLVGGAVASSLWPAFKGQPVLVSWKRNYQALELVLCGKNPIEPIVLDLKGAKGQPPLDWFFRDVEKDSVPGCGYYQALRKVQGRKPHTVVVGVVDTGIDFSHPQLSTHRWENKREIPNNNRDDDRNGYVDDREGWYWLRFADKSFLRNDQAEAVRIVLAQGTSTVLGKQAGYLLEVENALNEQYKVALSDSIQFKRALNFFGEHIQDGEFSIDKLKALPNDDNPFRSATKQLLLFLYRPTSVSWSSFCKRILANYSRYKSVFESNWNYVYNEAHHPLGLPPKKLTGCGDAPLLNELSIVTHGTLVSGLITAPDNLGDPGFIKLMNLGAAPQNGDERDEYIAAAIRYAVDQGAKVINISVAKRLSPKKILLDEVIAYAEKKDVLIINCAGNDYMNTDSIPYYPIASSFSHQRTTNFIEVGNSGYEWNARLAYFSSNYGESTVDLFAPGTMIRSTAPNHSYSMATGTSMSAPLVARVAALIRSYFPKLSAHTVKNILIDSVTRPGFLVYKPGTSQLVPFNRLCRSGGILNAEKAIELALQKSNN